MTNRIISCRQFLPIAMTRSSKQKKQNQKKCLFDFFSPTLKFSGPRIHSILEQCNAPKLYLQRVKNLRGFNAFISYKLYDNVFLANDIPLSMAVLQTKLPLQVLTNRIASSLDNLSICCSIKLFNKDGFRKVTVVTAISQVLLLLF